MHRAFFFWQKNGWVTLVRSYESLEDRPPSNFLANSSLEQLQILSLTRMTRMRLHHTPSSSGDDHIKLPKSFLALPEVI